ncbi:MAG: TonB-dependent receptor [Crocinitomicaceae bacterium]|nr:TonB-dependent receptor [Crocinitomicaceae bacterium]
MKLLFTISLFTSTSIFAQNITIQDETGKPVQGVFIYSKKNQAGVISDKDGIANLKAFEHDEYLYFSHLQFKLKKILKEDAVEIGVVVLLADENIFPPVVYEHPLRYNVDSDDEAGKIETISREIVKIENPPTSADMLQNTGHVLVQKSQGGGGSPIIRGFEANKLLLVIDGVRMNNAIYRSGHLQNSITIDNSVLDHTEIIFGPSSSLYGSDALGGVIHFHTKDPKINEVDTTYFEGSSYVRYNTNNNGMTGHFDFSTGRNKWGVLSSITASRFGDMVMGENRILHGDSLWGLHPYYVIRVDDMDTMVANPNPNIQVGTGYTQFDVLQKLMYKANDHLTMSLNFQYSTSSRINRYDKLTEYTGGQLKYAEWYYGPQNRLLSQLKFEFNRRPNQDLNKKKLYTTGALSLAYQRIDEDRISRRFQNDLRQHQEEDLNVFSLNLDFNKVFAKSRVLFYGIEAQHNLVKSTAYEQNIFSEGRVDIQTRYPNFSNYLSSGIYVEYKQKFKNNATLTSGLRYSLVYANSQFKDTSFISLPYNEVNILTSAPSGNIGLVLRPDSISRVRILGTSGFRAPNVDDYGKIFEKSGITVVPNDDIKPEYAFGAEFSVERSFFKRLLEISGTVYSTYLFNAMVQRDFELNGQDSIMYEGEMTKIQAIQNTDNAIVYGASASLRVNFTQDLRFDYTYNYTKGIDLANDTPLEHIPPQFGKISLTYEKDDLNTALYSFYNFRKRADDYTPGGDNIDLTPNEGGIPPWWTLNYRISYTFWETLTLQAAVENILDVHYRQFASGISALGRNFMFSLKADF